jgi:hypothetical protein
MKLTQSCSFEIYKSNFYFIFLRYQHTTKSVKIQNTWSKEEVNDYVDSWVNEFGGKNLCPHFTSWLYELK